MICLHVQVTILKNMARRGERGGGGREREEKLSEGL
jgi:hypothetical protein